MATMKRLVLAMCFLLLLSAGVKAQQQTDATSVDITVSLPILVKLSQYNLDFGNVPIASASGPHTVTLTNYGVSTVNISNISLTGINAADFSQTNTCGTALSVGHNCTFTVLFTPSLPSVEQARLSVFDDATGAPQTVTLSGTGLHNVVLTWTSSITFGVIGYNIYRGASTSGESTIPLNPAPINGNTYIDLAVLPGIKYFYVATALASDGTTQSANSNEASATIPQP
jgi:hypothetical protein